MALSSLTTRLEKAQTHMAVMMWVMALTLLLQGCCLCSRGQTATGCMKWTVDGENVCCDACHPGNRLIKACGPNATDLCKPCEPGTFSTDRLNNVCPTCKQCVGAQVLVKECTATTDTKCGCEEGLTCGNKDCSFCVRKCKKGYEPTADRSCRPCPDGTFNDKPNEKCKPWKTKCQHPGEHIVAEGDTIKDIQCANSTVSLVHNKPPSEPVWPYLVVFVLIGLALVAFSVSSFIVVLKNKKRQKTKKAPTNPPIIRTPTDDPTTLIAIECSFHEAQQEQGGSSESVDSKDSSHQLIA
ncbi:tumor necrosis factor receptor superfamily member 9a [Solea solea]|uniref:tumor necrosis factor receptor superfamily member 9a n=1 Tax=Solea solea TaxID=90069 RepID=UPI00272CB753|nr:tumor necrosis factor receptor superfamily member 9a [Solea solea]